MDNIVCFNSALYALPQKIRRVLLFLPNNVKNEAEEIRLRRGLPVTLTVKGMPYFIGVDGRISEYITKDLLKAEATDIEESFRLLCKNSVYAHTKELKKGYIKMNAGHRAGVCGTVIDEGMKDIYSVNIRIARQISGCADKLLKSFKGMGMLIAGPPASGKTTMLKDMIRQLSSGNNGRFYRVAVIDSRGELSASTNGDCINDLGPNTDVLLTEDKASGAVMALRTMYPDIIAFDEIGTAAELESVAECFSAGASIITTAHIGTKSDLLRRSVTKALIKSGAVSDIAVLPPRLSGEPEIISVKELLNEPYN